MRRVSSSLQLDKQTTIKQRRSASLSQIDVKVSLWSPGNVTLTDSEFVQAETALSCKDKDSPSDVLLPTDEFIRNIGERWKVFRNLAGRIFYHDTSTQRSSWKPPRNLKPKSSLHVGEVKAPPVVSMVRHSIREIEDSELLGNIQLEELRVCDICLVLQFPPGMLNISTRGRAIFTTRTWPLDRNGTQRWTVRPDSTSTPR